MAKATATVFNQVGEKILLGNYEVSIKECPLPRVKRFQQVWGSFFEEFNKLQAVAKVAAEAGEDVDNVNQWSQLFDIALEKPYEIMAVLVPDLPQEPFLDEDDGVTVPQLFDAFDTILRVNRLEWLKKLTPFFQNMILSTDPTTVLSGSARIESMDES